MFTRAQKLSVLSLCSLSLAVGACDNQDLVASARNAQSSGGGTAHAGNNGLGADAGAAANGSAGTDHASAGSNNGSSGHGNTSAGASAGGDAGNDDAGSGGDATNTGGTANGGAGAGLAGTNNAGSSSGGSGAAAGSAGTAGSAGATALSFTPTGLGAVGCMAQLGGANATVQPRAVTSDSLGNLIVTGGFFGTVNFGGKSLSSQGNSRFDLFLAKYDSSCALKWAKSFSSNASGGPNSVDQGLALAVASNDDILLAGGATAAINLGGGIILENGGALYARFASDGTHVWSHLTGNAVQYTATGVAVAPNGNIALTFNAGFGPNAHTRVAEFNAAGSTQLWSTIIDVGPADYLNTSAAAVAVDPNGNVFATGASCPASGCGTCPPGQSCYSSSKNTYLAAYSPTGTQTWFSAVAPDPSSFDMSTYNLGLGIAADANSVVGVGRASPPVNFGSGALSGFGSSDSFVARYSTGGGLMKAYLDGESGPDFISGVAMDVGSNLAFVGRSGTFGVVGVYAPGGDLFWIKALATPAVEAVALAPGHVVATLGSFFGSVDFGKGPVTSVGSQDAFLATYAE